METQKPRGRNTDTTAAVRTRVANQARRRHARYIAELAEYGVFVQLPDSYTGDKISDQS